MAEAAKRASKLTTLTIGEVKVPVGLFTTKQDPKSVAKFATAGPNGGVLAYETRAVAAPVGEGDGPDVPVQSDPLAVGDVVAADPGPEARDEAPEPEVTQAAVVPGEYKQVLVEAGTGEVVEKEKVRRGIRREDGSFIDLTDQVEAIDERTKLERMDVVGFIDSTRVTRSRVLGSYFVGAGDDPQAPRALRLIAEGLKKTRRAGVVKWTKASRQTLGVLVSEGGTLRLLELAWAEDLREAPAKAAVIAKAVVTESEVDAVCELIEAMSDTTETLDNLRDDAIALREELIARAEAGEMDVRVVEPVAEAESAPDLEAALTASIAAVRAGKV